eukprot:GEZU01015503.1.p1 GENE.GEZU01015503.1~~GEZU01015503.1.p1  ORF type:complete len:527 (-),score=124.49 GEZU01015503.1:55-1635(-)
MSAIELFYWATLAISTAVALIIGSCLVLYERSKRRLSHIPVQTSQFFAHFGLLSLVLPEFIAPIRMHTYFYHFGDVFKKTGAKLLAFSSCRTNAIFLNDADLIKEVMLKSKLFPKPLQSYKILKLWGDNILTTEGAEWRKHRTIANPAFGDENLELVWTTTLRSLESLFAKWDSNINKSNGGGTLVDVENDMVALTLAVIAEAGFGKKFEDDASASSARGKLSFKDSLTVVSTKLTIRMALPSFLFKTRLFPKLHQIGKAFDSFEEYMNEIIRSRPTTSATAANKDADTTDANRCRDILSLLLNASAESGNGSLSNQEILSDVFMFLLAGHETSAHTLTWAFAILAQHPDVQEKILAEVNEVFGVGDASREPVYADYEKLIYTRCVFKETLRLFPAVVLIPKTCSEDVILDGYHIPARTPINVFAWALHHNPKYYDNPEEFRPERFDTRVSPPIHPYAFIPFSAGSRSCIGMKFSQVESVLILAMVVKNYTIHVPDGVDVKEMMKAYTVITLQPVNPLHLVLKRRS